jgi:phage protein U
MSDVLMSLGPFAFYATAPSFEKLRFEANFRWPAQERLASDVAHQFLGPGERAITLDGVMYPEAFGGAGMLESMHATARVGTVYPLISMKDGALSGEVMGLWFISRLNNVRSSFGNSGARKIEFSIELKAYGSDGSYLGGLF